MLSRKTHLDEINRFHDIQLSLNKQIKNETDDDKEYYLLKKYMKINEIWKEIDDFIEFELKSKLDEFEQENN